MLTYITGLFLVFCGMIMGYFLSRNDNTSDDEGRRRIHKENSDLRASLKRGKASLSELEEKYSRQNGQLNVLQQLCDEWSTSREEGERDRTKLEVMLSEQQTKCEELHTQLQTEAERRMEVEELLHTSEKSHNDRLSAIESDWSHRYTEVESSLAERSNDLKHLLDQKSRTADQLHMAQARIAELMSELGSQKTMYDTACSNVSGLTQEYTSLETSVQDLRDQLKTAEANCARAISAKNLAEESLAALKKQQDELRREIVELKGSLNGMESLRQQYSTLETSLASSDDRVKIVASERDRAIGAEKAAHEHVIGLQKQIENQESTIQSLRKRHDEMLESMRSEVESRNELERKFLQERTKLRHDYDTQAASFRTIQSERDDLARLLDTEKGQRVHFEQSWQESMSSFESTSSTCTRLNAELDAAQKSLDQAQHELESNREGHEFTRAKLSEAKSEVKRLQDLLEQEKRHHTEYSTSFDQTVVELDAYKSRFAQMESDRSSLDMEWSTKFAQLQSRCDTVEQEREGLVSEVSELKSRLVHETELRDELTSRKTDLEEALRVLKARCDAMMTELSELQSIRDKHAVASDKWKEYRIRLEQTINQRDNSMSEVGTYQSEIRRLQGQLHEANDTIEELRKRIAKLEERNTEPMIISLNNARPTVDMEYGGETRIHESRGRVFTSRPQKVDDLKLISGVATVLEGRLNDFGVYTFRQVMEWDRSNIAEFQQLLPQFKDRILRDDWVGQASHLYDHFHGEEQAARAA